MKVGVSELAASGGGVSDVSTGEFVSFSLTRSFSAVDLLTSSQ